jgi:DNA polymerase-1
MLGVDTAAVTDEQRNLAKAIVLGMNYGLSAYGLPLYAFTNLGIKDMTVEEAEYYVEAFYDLYPKIRDYHEGVLETLNEMGGIDQRTMTGRLRADITNRNEAINAPIQGTSADVLKRAMALAYGRLKAFDDAFVIASIHDELLVECNEGDAEAVAGVLEGAMLEAADEILNADEPKVKIEVDVAVGRRWMKGWARSSGLTLRAFASLRRASCRVTARPRRRGCRVPQGPLPSLQRVMKFLASAHVLLREVVWWTHSRGTWS